jgi:hypothetical protein
MGLDPKLQKPSLYDFEYLWEPASFCILLSYFKYLGRSKRMTLARKYGPAIIYKQTPAYPNGPDPNLRAAAVLNVQLTRLSLVSEQMHSILVLKAYLLTIVVY